MINVQYFARYRETLGLDGESLDWHADVQTLAQLREQLAARGGAWAVLAEQNLMCARNQDLCSLDEAVSAGDEVAFFPTVTGG